MKVPFFSQLQRIPWFKITAIGTFLFFMGFMTFVAVYTHVTPSHATQIKAQKIQEIRHQANAQKDK